MSAAPFPRARPGSDGGMADERKRFPWWLIACAALLVPLAAVVGFIETLGRHGSVVQNYELVKEGMSQPEDVYRTSLNSVWIVLDKGSHSGKSRFGFLAPRQNVNQISQGAAHIMCAVGAQLKALDCRRRQPLAPGVAPKTDPESILCGCSRV